MLTARITAFVDKHRTVSINQLLLLTTALIVLLGNHALWTNLWSAVGRHPLEHVGFMTSFVLLVSTLTVLLLSLGAFARSAKAVMIVMLMLSAVMSFFIDNMHVLFSVSMIGNIFETDTREAGELISGGLVLHVLLYGVLPSLLVAGLRLKAGTPANELTARLKLLSVMALVAMLSVFWTYKDYSLVIRANRSLRYMINPVAPVVSLTKYIKQQTVGVDRTLQPVFADAVRPLPASVQSRKSLLIIVVGETARAMNFSLNGYSRDTNPLLSKMNLVDFHNASSCGTATAESVPCMFSDLDREHFSTQSAKHRQNLLDALAIAGIDVLWRDNNSSCKGVCARVPYENLLDMKVPILCEKGECYDEILLHGLDDYISALDKDGVIVLHQKGSHGPAYYKRYPRRFAVFQPECRQSDVQNCSRDEIINAYDNTIVYDDYFLAQVIDKLKKYDDRFDTAMVYMSDHGESLGENGIYLHGLPYLFAPQEQTRVPFMIWLSKSMQSDKQIDLQCLQGHSRDAVSHDNLLHSVLGLMDISTAAYDAHLDVFSPCRSHLMVKGSAEPTHGSS